MRFRGPGFTRPPRRHLWQLLSIGQHVDSGEATPAAGQPECSFGRARLTYHELVQPPARVFFLNVGSAFKCRVRAENMNK